MKTSNKFLFAAVVFTLLSLVVYDLMLKAEYKSGDYTDPYKNFVTLNFKDFDVLDLHSSTAANVKLVQGPFSVRIDENAKGYVQVRQEGTTSSDRCRLRWKLSKHAQPIYSFDFLPETFRSKYQCQLPGK